MNIIAGQSGKPQLEDWVTLAEVAEHLMISGPTVRVWMSKGMIPNSCYITMNNVTRFKLSLVDAALLEYGSTSGVDTPGYISKEVFQERLKGSLPTDDGDPDPQMELDFTPVDDGDDVTLGDLVRNDD